MKTVYARPKTLKDVQNHYCPGCGHSIIHRLLAEVIDELDIRGKCLGVPPCGCAVLAYYYLDVDMVEAAHGRGVAVATGMKRCLPEKVVFTYQGDGDLAAIGIAELMHGVNRGERITTIFVNNGVYGMTGGQMAPTTPVGHKSTTTPNGRNQSTDGPAFKMCELLAPLEGAAYLARGSVHNPKHVNRTKKFIRDAFEVQLAGHGFSMVEILSPCPSNWKMDPIQSCSFVDTVMSEEFPLGLIKDVRKKSHD